jgi:hypothetical protein
VSRPPCTAGCASPSRWWRLRTRSVTHSRLS